MSRKITLQNVPIACRISGKTNNFESGMHCDIKVGTFRKNPMSKNKTHKSVV